MAQHSDNASVVAMATDSSLVRDLTQIAAIPCTSLLCLSRALRSIGFFRRLKFEDGVMHMQVVTTMRFSQLMLMLDVLTMAWLVWIG